MRFPNASAAIAAICLSFPSTAQEVQVFNANGERASSTLVLFGSDIMAGITIAHGQPAWKDEYTEQIEKLKGRTNRLGKDFWTTFMTSIPMSFGGSMVAPGSYVVGLHCDDAGTFSLAMIDASKAMKKGHMPFGAYNWKPDVTTPLTLNKNAKKKSVKKMLMTLANDKKDPMKGMFTLAWGPHTLTAPIALMPKKADKGN
jgi:hypothetical protein